MWCTSVRVPNNVNHSPRSQYNLIFSTPLHSTMILYPSMILPFQSALKPYKVLNWLRAALRELRSNNFISIKSFGIKRLLVFKYIVLYKQRKWNGTLIHHKTSAEYWYSTTRQKHDRWASSQKHNCYVWIDVIFY